MIRMRKVVAMLCSMVMLLDVAAGEGFIYEEVKADDAVQIISESSVLYSGTSGFLDWSVDSSGCLTISGSGDFKCDTIINDYPMYFPEWTLHNDIITSAIVNVTDIKEAGSMFDSLYNLEKVEFIKFESSSEDVNIFYMFSECEKIREVDLSSWNVNGVLDAESMFYGCTSLQRVDLSSLDLSDAFTTDFFYGCTSLTSIKTPLNVTTDIVLPTGNWYDDNGNSYSALPKEISYSVNLAYKVDNEKKPVAEINGYQISTSASGFRTIYSVSDPNREVVSAGLIYGLADYSKDCDMVINSGNAYVYDFEATNAGKLSSSFSELESSTSYVMTMTFGEYPIEYFTTPTIVRAYAKLSDGSYIYSDIATYTVYDVADQVYSNNLKKNISAHNYLYTEILSKVNPEYKEVEFAGNNALVNP